MRTIHGERAPIDKLMKRAHVYCWGRQGGRILKVWPTLEPRSSPKGVYWVRSWHVQYEHPVTKAVLWVQLEYLHRRGKWLIFARRQTRPTPRCVELERLTR